MPASINVQKNWIIKKEICIKNTSQKRQKKQLLTETMKEEKGVSFQIHEMREQGRSIRINKNNSGKRCC